MSASSRIDQVFVATPHTLFPVSLTRVQGEDDPCPLLVLKEVREALCAPLVSTSAFNTRTDEVLKGRGDEVEAYTRSGITPQERAVLVSLQVLEQKSITQVTLG